MSKKIIRSGAIGLVLSMALTACGSVEIGTGSIKQKENNELVTLRVWGAEEDQGLLNQLAEGFKQEYSNEASFEIVVEVADEVKSKEVILSDVNNAPDVFTFADNQLMPFAAAGVLDVIDYEEEIAKNNLIGAVEAATLNEKIYAYPLTADNGYFMYYNKDYFTEEDVKSLDRMLQIAEQNNKKISIEVSSGWYLYSFFGNTGLTLGVNDDYMTNYCTWNASHGEIKGTDVLEAMQRITASDGFVNQNDEEFINGVKDGSVIAGINGIWNAKVVNEVWQDKYAAIKLPTYKVAGKDVQMASYAGYKMIGVNSYSDNRYWAELLAKYLTNENSQLERFKQRGQGPSNTNAANSLEVKNSIAMNALIQQSEFAAPQRVGELYWPAAVELGEMLVSRNLQGLTPQQVLDRTVAKITSNTITE